MLLDREKASAPVKYVQIHMVVLLRGAAIQSLLLTTTIRPGSGVAPRPLYGDTHQVGQCFVQLSISTHPPW